MSLSTTTILADTVWQSNGTGMKSLNLAIHFHGHTLSHISPPRIPLEISIRIPKEFAVHVSPVLEGAPELGSPVQISRNVDIAAYPDFPFFPLPSTFDHRTTNSWAMLANEIQSWMIGSVFDTQSNDWLWGREFFWMAYIGAHPQFPFGEWPPWNPKISMEGVFVSCWTKASGGNLPRPGSTSLIRQNIWREFQQLIAAVLSNLNPTVA
ncbi:hypothetical protein BJ138DRAFT_1119926 [Hygrophoropsis aurantiaca]|uniref:Uncharacterized protein n=1 Tax=Hygrophoropsis aurantiaca TaxID=72124 RepID=A0ACB7ZS66_9AGAM|nr:hypothetical protein BJ138DRAFT_1119926 [Hygrophoropsis aurantiaca]